MALPYWQGCASFNCREVQCFKVLMYLFINFELRSRGFFYTLLKYYIGNFVGKYMKNLFNLHK